MVIPDYQGLPGAYVHVRKVCLYEVSVTRLNCIFGVV